jgi:hypothetical protein
MYTRILLVDGRSVNFLVDTGSPITVIPKWLLYDNKVMKPAPLVRCYYGNPLKILGVTNVRINYGDQTSNFDVFVINANHRPILGCNVLNSFQMIQIAPISIDGHKVEADLIPRGNINDKILPKFKPRSLPFSIRTKVEDDIKEKVKNGILVPEQRPLIACPIVPVVKPNGEVRVCEDTLSPLIN